MAFNRDKFKSLVHYVCSEIEPEKLGVTKLNKTCWLTDFVSYYQTGEAVTDAVYIKRQYGPVPRAIVSTLRELENEGRIVISEKIYYGRSQKQIHSLKAPNVSMFSEKELLLIDGMAKYVSENHTASSISELSHDHIWKAAVDGEEIPYFTVFAVPVPVSDSVREWASMEIEDIEAKAA